MTISNSTDLQPGVRLSLKVTIHSKPAGPSLYTPERPIRVFPSPVVLLAALHLPSGHVSSFKCKIQRWEGKENLYFRCRRFKSLEYQWNQNSKKTDACVHMAARIHALQMKWVSISAFPWFYPLGRHHNNSTQSPLICLEMYSDLLQPPLSLCWPFKVQMHTAVMGTSVAQLACCPVSHRPLALLGGRTAREGREPFVGLK